MNLSVRWGTPNIQKISTDLKPIFYQTDSIATWFVFENGNSGQFGFENQMETRFQQNSDRPHMCVLHKYAVWIDVLCWRGFFLMCHRHFYIPASYAHYSVCSVSAVAPCETRTLTCWSWIAHSAYYLRVLHFWNIAPLCTEARCGYVLLL